MPFTVRAAITALFVVALTHNPVHAQVNDDSSAVERGEVSLADDEIGEVSHYQSDWQEFSTERLVGRSLLATCGLATACLLALWSSRRVRAQRGSAANMASMAVLETLNLAPRCSLQLVRVDGQKFLVARDTSGVRSITPVSSFDDAMAEQSETFSEVFPAIESNLHRGRDACADHGLSLELAPQRVSASESGARRDPWQGPSLIR
ncbi:MAG: FliO/MopB family protein [Planctomycetales bacterium]|nr:FliO/MopB family protein [Planctomycetales bacterium]